MDVVMVPVPEELVGAVERFLMMKGMMGRGVSVNRELGRGPAADTRCPLSRGLVGGRRHQALRRRHGGHAARTRSLGWSIHETVGVAYELGELLLAAFRTDSHASRRFCLRRATWMRSIGTIVWCTSAWRSHARSSRPSVSSPASRSNEGDVSVLGDVVAPLIAAVGRATHHRDRRACGARPPCTCSTTSVPTRSCTSSTRSRSSIPPSTSGAFPGRYFFHGTSASTCSPRAGPCDVALIDGDHNWYTVYNELRLLAEAARREAEPLPVLILHDVCWPYGRRDLYYDPAEIPAEFRQPYARRGMRPGARSCCSAAG